MIKRMMAEVRALKTFSSSSYKRQMEDLMVTSRKLQPAEGEEEEKEPKVSFLRNGRKVAGS